MKQKLILTICIMLIVSAKILAAPPTWSVNPGDYNYNMTITGVVSLDFIESLDQNDIVGAFIDGECRGVQNLVLDVTTGRYVAYLMIYSNSVSGTIDFKIYDASTDSEILIPVTMDFSVDGITGSTDFPYIWSNPTLSSEAEMLTFSFPGQTGGTTYNATDISVTMPYGTDVTALVADYTTSPYARVQVAGITQTTGNTPNNFTTSLDYVVRAADETAEQTYTVSVSFANATPTDIFITSLEVVESAELGTIIGTVSSEDANSEDTHSYSLIAGVGDTDNGSFNISDNELQLNTALDYETKTSYTVRIQTDDDNGGLFEKQFTISVVDENDETPQFIADAISLPENEPLQAIYTVTATDNDISPAFKVLNYSLTGGNEEAKFSIHPTDGVISLISALDYEATTLYELEVSVTDGINTGINIITINVTDENDETPTVTGATIQLLETTLPGEEVWDVVATDTDANSTFTYSITNGNTGSAFEINPTTGTITVANSLDYETTTAYTLEVSVSDAINIGIGTIQINLVDVNDEAPQVEDAAVSINETTVLNTAIHTITATDDDANTTFSYSIVSGNTNSSFGINTNTGVIQVLTSLDFENIATYYLTVAANDGIQTSTAVITISIIDENDEVPTVINQDLTVSEIEVIGFSVTDITANDADANSTFTYYITTGNEDGKFSINMNTGEVLLADLLNYEVTSQYTLGIRVNDGINNGLGEIVINVQAVNDEFPSVVSAIVNLDELAIFGQIVHTMVATDPDGGAVLTYSIIGGNTDNAFNIDSDHGTVTVLGNLDFETTENYDLIIQADDGLHQSTGILTINMTNSNDETPSVTNSSTLIDENLTICSQVTQVIATDTDGISTFEYSIISGNIENAFAVEAASGSITVNNLLDFETTTTYDLIVNVSDGVNSGTGTITVTINDINDEVPTVESEEIYISEDHTINTEVLQITANDRDAGTTLSYSIISGNIEDKFVIDAQTGIITLSNLLDYETTTTYTLEIEVFDAVDTGVGTITVNIQDINDEFPTVTPAIVNIPESAIFGEIVHQTIASDPDGETVLTYEITNGNTNSDFAIDPGYGIITILGDLDYEITPTYELEVSVNDGLHTSTGIITINLLNENDETPIVTEEIVNIIEDLVGNSQVLQVQAVDPDGTQELEYSIIAGNSENMFAIEASTGIVTLAGTLDYETVTSYLLEIGVFDGVETGNATITINVIDINDETPVIEDGVAYINETSPILTEVYSIIAHDPDQGTTLNFAITEGNFEGKFSIADTTGIVTLSADLDFEITQNYTLQISVYDGVETAFSTLQINVIDQNDELPIVPDATVYVPEDATPGFLVHTVNATDADANTSLTYEISSGNIDGFFSINEQIGMILLTGTLDYETETSYILEVSVFDGLHTSKGNIYINVTDVDDNTPVVEDAEVSIEETETIGTIVHNVIATDADGISVLSYSIFAGNETGAFLINPSSGAITLSDNLDFETKTDYVLQVDVTDGTNSASGIITIHVEDMNDEIPVFEDITLTVGEFADIETIIGQLTATDADADTDFTFTIDAEDDNRVFALTMDGELSLTEYIDFETTPFYEITILVYDGLNTGTGTLTIEILDEDESLFNAVNVFSPNGDGINEFWELENNHIFRDCEFVIFNNIGEIIYQETGYNNDWDGTYNGSPLAVGTYYYIVKCPDCTSCKHAGAISIIR